MSEQIAEAALIPRLLTWVVEKACRFPRVVLGVTLCTCALSIWAAVTRLEYRTQRSDLVSPNKDYQKRWKEYLAEFGDDDDIVVVVKGKDRRRMQDALEALAADVNRRPEHFDRLFYKVDLRSLSNRALLFLPTEQIGQILDNLKSMSMLLEPPLVGSLDPLIGWKSLTLQQLLHEARTRAGKIIPERPLHAADDQFFGQLNAICNAASQVIDNPNSYRSPWQSLLARPPEQQDLLSKPQYFFSGDGSLAFLLTRPVKEKGSFTDSAASVTAMRGIVARLSRLFPDLELGLTGLPVLESDEMTASQQDTNLASWLALAGVAFLYLIVFRSFRNPLLTVGTLLVGTIWALGWLTLTVGHLNILSATFAVMLIGMGDYGVLWVTRYEEEHDSGGTGLEAMRNTALSVGTGILTAATTTALAFFAAMLADFQAVAELGWIAGSGVLLCAFACFTVLPAMLTVFPPAPEGRLTGSRLGILPFGNRPSASGNSLWLPLLSRRPWAVVTVSVGLCCVLGVFATRVYYDHNLLHMQARDLESVKWELTLIEHTAGASWHSLSYTSTPEDALALKARYEQMPDVVSRVVEVASLVPGDQPQKLEQLQEIQRRLRRLPERGTIIAHALPSIRAMKTELDCLIGSLQPLADASPQPLLAGLRRSLMGLRDRLGEVPPIITAPRIQQLEQNLAGDLAEDLHRLRDVSTPAAIAVADLPRDLRERYIGANGKWLLRVFGKDCLWDYGPLAQFVDKISSVDPEATGKPFATLEGLRAMKQGFLWAGIYALAAIVAVLLFDFRKPGRILIALTPLAMGVVLTLGIMGLCSLPLNPANMIAFPLILGVGIDNGVHVLHDYLSHRGRRRPYALNHTTGRGIMVAALTTVLGFGTLMISHHRGLFGLGFILALGVSCCMLSALVFLPAVLRLLSTRREMPQQEDGPYETPRLAA